ncbi:MAG TPA: hypothetical protein VH370_02025 [Humisphaera sp.]|nr:hypothetical protein [Humisphaera sp.]
MRILSALILLGICIGLVSCGGDAQPSSTSATVAMNAPPPAPANLPGNKGPTPVTSAHVTKAADPDAPPADAQFMIYCGDVRGPDHVQRAIALKRELISETKRQAWHVLHSQDKSTLYFGYYRTFNDPQNDPEETARAQTDRHYIEGIKDGLGDRRFTSAMFEPVNSPDPEAPPEWNLANAPAESFWSLQIGAYQGSPERKQAAVEMVGDLRKAGYTAYYFHGDTISSVCVGTWPRSAVREQGMRDDAHTADPSQPLLVLSDKIPTGINPITYDKEGNRVLIEGLQLDIVDESMKKTIADFPYHFRNGQYMGKMANGTTVRDPSFLVYVPHDQATLSVGPINKEDATRDAVRSGAYDAAAAIVSPQAGQQQQPAQQQPAKLRSIEGR